MSKSELEETLAGQMRMAQFPDPEREWRFHPVRRWRFDFAYPHLTAGPLAIEVEGGTWSRGRHNRGAGFKADCEKYNEATIRGWRVIRVTGGMIDSGQAIDQIGRALAVW